MDLGKEEKQIQEIKELKFQLTCWRWGLTGVAAFIALVSIGTVNKAFRGLTDKGPRQDEFIRELSAQMRSDVAPIVEDMARQTINEVRPEIETAIEDVNSQMPALAQSALTEFDQLQYNLPARGEKVLKDKFVAMLLKKEDELHQLFPEATDEQIERLLTNLAESAGLEAQGAALELFGPHIDSLITINENIEVIHQKEAATLAGVDPTWEMGLLVLDIFREDLERNRPDKAIIANKKTQTLTAAQTVGDTAKSAKVAKTAKVTKPSKKKGGKK